MQNNQKSVPKKRPYNMNNFLVSAYLLFMFTFFEMYLTKQFSYARSNKFELFLITAGALVLAITVASILMYTDKATKQQYGLTKDIGYFKFSATDIAFFAFFIFAAISTLLSDYKMLSALGFDETASSGRNNGLLLLTAYTAVYFIISRFYYYKEYVIIAFMVFGSIISGLAVLNFFYIDPIGLYDGYSQSIIEDFCTTIGNKNLTCSYMCIFLACALMLFIVIKKRYMQITSGVALIFAFYGLLAAGSNSGYIGFAAMLFVALAVSIRHLHLLKRFFFAMTLMLGSSILLRFIVMLSGDNHKEFEPIGDTLINSNMTIIAVFVVALLTIGLYALDMYTKASQHWPKNTLMIIVLSLGVAAIITVFYLIYYYTVVDTTTNLGSLERLLRFNERWGTHRGFYWIHSMESFADFSFIDKLFGTGCDTFYYVLEPFFPQMIAKFNESSTNCAHNEYINYLITQGILGLGAYLTIIISTIVRAVKTAKANKMVFIYLLPVIAYCAQAVVNLYQPITTPFLIIFIALCEAATRTQKTLTA